MDNKQGITVRNLIKAVLADHDKKSGWLAGRAILQIAQHRFLVVQQQDTAFLGSAW